jgi:hypothetical protein
MRRSRGCGDRGTAVVGDRRSGVEGRNKRDCVVCKRGRFRPKVDFRGIETLRLIKDVFKRDIRGVTHYHCLAPKRLLCVTIRFRHSIGIKLIPMFS